MAKPLSQWPRIAVGVGELRGHGVGQAGAIVAGMEPLFLRRLMQRAEKYVWVPQSREMTACRPLTTDSNS
jgi:hypothetical protein